MNEQKQQSGCNYLFIYLFICIMKIMCVRYTDTEFKHNVGRCRSKLNAKNLICCICAANHLQFLLFFFLEGMSKQSLNYAETNLLSFSS